MPGRRENVCVAAWSRRWKVQKELPRSRRAWLFCCMSYQGLGGHSRGTERQGGKFEESLLHALSVHAILELSHRAGNPAGLPQVVGFILRSGNEPPNQQLAAWFKHSISKLCPQVDPSILYFTLFLQSTKHVFPAYFWSDQRETWKLCNTEVLHTAAALCRDALASCTCGYPSFPWV